MHTYVTDGVSIFHRVSRVRVGRVVSIFKMATWSDVCQVQWEHATETIDNTPMVAISYAYDERL